MSMKTILALILASAVIFSVTSCANKLPNQEESILFPEFKVNDLQDKEVNLRSYKGKIVIINLFATWCPPCQQEILHFIDLQKKYKEIIAIVGLSYDKGGSDVVISFAKETNINYNLYWGSDQIFEYTKSKGLPYTLIIDQTGHIAYTFEGYRHKYTYEKAIKSLL